MLKDYIDSKISEAYDFIQNDTEKALEIFNEILEIESDNIDAINGKGSALIKLNRLEESEKCFNHSLSIYESSSAYINKGIISKYKNNNKEALTYYHKALKINPDLENIITILKEELTKDIIINDIANDLIKKATDLKDENKLWDALEELIKSSIRYPSCENKVNKVITEILFKIEKEFIYDDENLSTDSPIDKLKMQSLRALREKNTKKALTLINLVLEINENDINALNHKGGILFTCREYQKSIECFNKCLSINKNYKCALFNKALVLRSMKDLFKSQYIFNKLLKVPEYHNKVKPYQREVIEKLQKENLI